MYFFIDFQNEKTLHVSSKVHYMKNIFHKRYNSISFDLLTVLSVKTVSREKMVNCDSGNIEVSANIHKRIQLTHFTCERPMMN